MPKMKLSQLFVLIAIGLLLVLSACSATTPPPPVTGVRDSLIPPLAKTSRQPPPPSECVPSCSAGLEQELNSWPAIPTPPARTASSAKPTTTP